MLGFFFSPLDIPLYIYVYCTYICRIKLVTRFLAILHMSNKTIYVSDKDEPLFERAKTIAGEALSSVISLALKEYVSRHEEKSKGFKEIGVKVGSYKSEREVKFVGTELGKWEGMSDDKEWWLEAKIFRTQKNNWAVYLVNIAKASLLTNPEEWEKSGDYLQNTRRADLLVGSDPEELKVKLPSSLYSTLLDLSEKDSKPVEYLDI